MKLLKLSLALASIVSYASADDLRGDLTGIHAYTVFPGDPSYNQVSQAFNARFTFHPAAVTFPSTPHQVAEIIKIGEKFNYKVIARSGGHSYIANGLGGKNGDVVVDLRNMTHIDVSASTGVATIHTGNRLADVALALNQKGRGIPHGLCPYVGIGGHSAHGGWGYASRMWGLTLDTITSIDVVLADGTITKISNKHKPDLFWAMRGAGSSFGITTAITVQSYPVPPVATAFAYDWDFSAADAAHAISLCQKFGETNIPKELSIELTFTKGTAAGRVHLSFTGGWYEQPDKLDGVLAPFLSQLPKPVSINNKVGSYIDIVTYLGGLGTLDVHSKPDTPNTFYAKSLMTPEASPIGDKALNAFTTYLSNQGFSTDLDWFIQLEMYGGKNSAINAVSVDATAFARRNALWTIQFYASSPNHQPPFPDSGLTWLDDLVSSITSNSPPDWDYGAYTNYIDNRLSNWQHMYYASHYGRLQSLKQKYDPKNTFSFPESIEL
ncbi:Glucooligosaccharide oxidase [Amanita muscaria Koide BX008]|uniref:Glucooligosaccharide oxidase n=1 Tax=Amanita muscaria (strain Koide BX008) TaxID=946122 RepID=A0A0C2WPL4_AMAMK|nr:Glucooligosaccharide oxidase [Amanita muscaria Koide BX008]